MKTFTLTLLIFASGWLGAANTMPLLDKTVHHYHLGDTVLQESDFAPKIAPGSARPEEVMAILEKLAVDHHTSKCGFTIERPDRHEIEITVRSQNSLGLVRLDSSLQPKTANAILETTKAHGFVEYAPFPLEDEGIRRAIGPEYHAVQIRVLDAPSGSPESVKAGTTYHVFKVYYGDSSHGPVLLATDLKTYESTPFAYFSASLHLSQPASGVCAVYGGDRPAHSSLF